MWLCLRAEGLEAYVLFIASFSVFSVQISLLMLTVDVTVAIHVTHSCLNIFIIISFHNS